MWDITRAPVKKQVPPLGRKSSVGMTAYEGEELLFVL